MKRVALIIALTAATIPAVSVAQTSSTNARIARQNSLHGILTKFKGDVVADLRSQCVVGDPMFGSLMLINASRGQLSVAEFCITVLTRSGRDGTLHYVKLSNGQTTAALAFDSGFVGGYRSREALPRNAPTMTTLLPIADRCLRQAESDTDLCKAAGHILGARAALGEVVPLT